MADRFRKTAGMDQTWTDARNMSIHRSTTAKLTGLNHGATANTPVTDTPPTVPVSVTPARQLRIVAAVS